jgi:hypothetical protein
LASGEDENVVLWYFLIVLDIRIEPVKIEHVLDIPVDTRGLEVC